MSTLGSFRYSAQLAYSSPPRVRKQLRARGSLAMSQMMFEYADMLLVPVSLARRFRQLEPTPARSLEGLLR